MESFYYLLGITVYMIFISRVILSYIFSDTDIDLDADGDMDFDLNSLFSPKGVLHFLMGFTGWICSRLFVSHTLEYYDYLIAGILGFLFFLSLGICYSVCYATKYEPRPREGKDLIGEKALIYLLKENNSEGFLYYALVEYKEVIVFSKTEVSLGSKVILNNYINNIYYL